MVGSVPVATNRSLTLGAGGSVGEGDGVGDGVRRGIVGVAVAVGVTDGEGVADGDGLGRSDAVSVAVGVAVAEAVAGAAIRANTASEPAAVPPVTMTARTTSKIRRCGPAIPILMLRGTPSVRRAGGVASQ
jgi:hypothetical protein